MVQIFINEYIQGFLSKLFEIFIINQEVADIIFELKLTINKALKSIKAQRGVLRNEKPKTVESANRNFILTKSDSFNSPLHESPKKTNTKLEHLPKGIQGLIKNFTYK